MAYNKAGDVILQDMCPVFGMPGTLGPIPLSNAVSEFETLIDVPWKECKLVSARFDCTTAIDTTAAMIIKLELNVADGTEMMAFSVTKGSAVASQAYATVTSAAACNSLDRDNAARDKINISTDGHDTGGTAGAGMLWLMFEPISNPGI